MNTRAETQNPIRLVIQQAAVPKYRVPVFRELASRPGIDLKLYYSGLPDLSNAEPDGFAASYYPMHLWHALGHPVMWHAAQWEFATRKHADVLLLAWDVHYALLVPALLRAKTNGVQTILWGHGYSKHEARWRKRLRDSVGRLATALLFYNHTTARRFIDDGWDPKRIFVALNALDQGPIQQARQHWLDRPEDLAAFRRQHGLEDVPVILFVSRLDPANRVDLLLEAMSQLDREGSRAKVVIIGKGPDEPHLRGLVDSLKLGDRVIFTGAIYEEMQLAPWFLSARAFCYPANIGLSLLHAFGYGLPVVTSDDIESQNPEIEALRDGENGLLYRDGSVEALAKALASMLGDDVLRSHLSDEAHRTATEVFTLSNMVDGHEAAVRYCLSGAESRAGLMRACFAKKDYRQPLPHPTR